MTWKIDFSKQAYKNPSNATNASNAINATNASNASNAINAMNLNLSHRHSRDFIVIPAAAGIQHIKDWIPGQY